MCESVCVRVYVLECMCEFTVCVTVCVYVRVYVRVFVSGSVRVCTCVLVHM